MSDTATVPASTEAKPIWPRRIEIIGVTGEFASGKTLFGLSIAPGPRTKVYDTEKSSGAYEQLGFKRVSIPDVMGKAKPQGYKPIDTFQWWWTDVKGTTPGEFDVIMIDTISEIEDGLVEWVQKNPTYFGHSSGQYAKMSGIMWGDVKTLWKSILTDLAARCQTFVFCSHMANVWSGDRPTGKRKPKGKETLMELASLYLLMERKKNDKGEMPAKPAANVLKDRLVHTRFNAESGELEMIPCLPPRIPVCTPAEIRRYIDNPPDYKKLKREERVQEDTLTADERELIALQKAEAERDAERMRLERLDKQKEMMDQQRQIQSSNQAAAHKAEVAGQFHKPQMPDLPADAAPATAQTPQPVSPTAEQLQRLLNLKNSLTSAGMMTDEAWRARMVKFNVIKAKELTVSQAATLITDLEAALNGAAA